MTETEKQESTVREWLTDQLEGTLKEPVGCIRHRFIDPGSVYDGNLWDWDTFWAAYGLLNLVEPDSPGRDWAEYAKGNVRNFFDHQEPDGYVPMMVEAKDTVPYLIRRHRDGKPLNMHKPFLARQTAMVSGWLGDSEWAAGFRDGLWRYFEKYRTDYFRESCGLYVWTDDVMIGMDNDPASFGRPEGSTANIFLNSFMVRELIAGAGMMETWGDRKAAAELRLRASRLEAAVRRECWDPRDRFFYSVDVDIRTRSYDWFHKGLGVFWKTLPIKIRAWSGFLPMWAGFALPEEADALARDHAADTRTFWSPGGVCSLAMDEKMFDLRATNNPSNWLGPIWLVVQYCVFRGLMNYGKTGQATELYHRTVGLLSRDIEKTGVLHEYYDPRTGEPVMNGGFVNWNILVLNMADELRGKPPVEEFISRFGS